MGILPGQGSRTLTAAGPLGASWETGWGFRMRVKCTEYREMESRSPVSCLGRKVQGHGGV